MKMAGMSHHIVDHLPVTSKTYSQPFGDASDWRRTVLKHYHCLLKKTEIVFICKVFNNARTENALTVKKCFLPFLRLQILRSCPTCHPADPVGLRSYR